MNNLEEVSKIVWEQCIAAKPNEKALIVTDPVGERLEIGEALTLTCPCKCRLMEMKPTGMPGREPTSEVAEAMLDAEIVLAPTQYSITHTKATAQARKAGARVATMPGITKDMFVRAIPVDYESMDQANQKLLEILSNIKRIKVTTKSGTQLQLDIMPGRRIFNDNGITRNRGDLNNLPAGEVGFAPKEGSTNGILVIDLSSLGKRVDSPFSITIKEGNAVSCENKELWDSLRDVEKGTNVAEFAVGTNPRAIVTGRILEDEKVLGTAHMAFGTSAALGGTVQTSIHLDNVFNRPTIEADGKVIIKEGKFLF